MLDLRNMSDEEFEQLRRDVLDDAERRKNLARIPEQVAELVECYEDCGGDPEDLIPQKIE